MRFVQEELRQWLYENQVLYTGSDQRLFSLYNIDLRNLFIDLADAEGRKDIELILKAAWWLIRLSNDAKGQEIRTRNHHDCFKSSIKDFF